MGVYSLALPQAPRMTLNLGADHRYGYHGLHSNDKGSWRVKDGVVVLEPEKAGSDEEVRYVPLRWSHFTYLIDENQMAAFAAMARAGKSHPELTKFEAGKPVKTPVFPERYRSFYEQGPVLASVDGFQEVGLVSLSTPSAKRVKPGALLAATDGKGPDLEVIMVGQDSLLVKARYVFPGGHAVRMADAYTTGDFDAAPHKTGTAFFGSFEEVSDDDVVRAMHFVGRDYPITKHLSFDDVMARIRGGGTPATSKRYPLLAAELTRLSKLSKDDLADVARLWNSYLNSSGNGWMNTGAHVPRSPSPSPEDARPEMADKWMYTMLRPSWNSTADSPRSQAILYMQQCDNDRFMKVLPEYIAFMFDGASGYPPQGTLAYDFYCFALTTPDARGVAAMRALWATQMQFGPGTFEDNIKFLMMNEERKAVWRKAFEDELKQPSLPAEWRKMLERSLAKG